MIMIVIVMIQTLNAWGFVSVVLKQHVFLSGGHQLKESSFGNIDWHHHILLQGGLDCAYSGLWHDYWDT